MTRFPILAVVWTAALVLGFAVVIGLGAPPATPLLAPGQSATATLEILDPGKRAVAFTFDFH